MAFVNNPNSWNGGSAVFNANPITETYLKLAAHREAKNQAFDQYHQKQLESIDRDGVRDIDAPDFQKKVQDWNTDWQMNKDRLKKGDIQAQIQNDKKYNELRSFINQSKARDLAKKDALTVGSTLKKENGTLPDDFLKDLDYNDRPINDTEIDPNDKQIKSRRINPVKYLGETAPWDAAKAMKQYEHIPRVPQEPIISPTDPNTGKRTITKVEGFDSNGLANIAAIAGSNYQNDPSFTKEVNGAVANPGTKQHLEQTYQQAMGHPIEPGHPEQYATALILSQQGLTKQTQSVEDDKQWIADQQQKREQQNIKLRQAGQVALQALRTNSQKELINYRKSLKDTDAKTQANVLDKTMQSIEDEAHRSGEMNLVSKGKQVGKFYTAPVPDVIKGALGRKDDKGKLQYPHEIGYNPDGTIKVIYYKTDPVTHERLPGNHIDNEKTHTITRGELKAIIGHKLFGVKTTSGADYDEDSDSVENDTDNDEESITPAGISVPKPATQKKKIPGF